MVESKPPETRITALGMDDALEDDTGGVTGVGGAIRRGAYRMI
jgi:hypothetical protein